MPSYARRLGVCTLAAVLTACATVGKPKQTTFPVVDYKPGAWQIQVVPAVSARGLTVEAVRYDATGAIIPGEPVGTALGIVVGALIIDAQNTRAGETAAQSELALREVVGDVDLAAHIASVSEIGESGHSWQVVGTDRPIEQFAIDARVDALLAGEDVDAVAVLTGYCELTASLDQLRVGVWQRVYMRGGERSDDGSRIPVSARHFVYLSPRHPLQFRPWRDDERAERAAEIEAAAREEMAVNRGKRMRIALRAREEIEDLNDSRRITKPMAVKETWTSDMVRAYIGEAREHLRYMILEDWNEPELTDFDRIYKTAFEAAENGTSVTKYGKPVGSIGNHSLYKTRYSTVYSVPNE